MPARVQPVIGGALASRVGAPVSLVKQAGLVGSAIRGLRNFGHSRLWLARRRLSEIGRGRHRVEYGAALSPEGAVGVDAGRTVVFANRPYANYRPADRFTLNPSGVEGGRSLPTAAISSRAEPLRGRLGVANDNAIYRGYSVPDGVMRDSRGFTLAYPTNVSQIPEWNMAGNAYGGPGGVRSVDIASHFVSPRGGGRFAQRAHNRLARKLFHDRRVDPYDIKYSRGFDTFAEYDPRTRLSGAGIYDPVAEAQSRIASRMAREGWKPTWRDRLSEFLSPTRQRQ